MSDQINHPSHYTKGDIECIDAIEAAGFGDDFCLGAVIKYVWRAKHKGAFVVDLYKARWYLNRVISRYEKDESREPVKERP